MVRSRRAKPEEIDLAIVGPGRLGQALGRLLAQRGLRIRFVGARRLSAARRAVRFIGAGKPVVLTNPALAAARVILITTSDAAIEPVARSLAGLARDWHGRVVLHTSGALSSAVLDPLKERGAAVGSLHPFQTIPSPTAGVRNLLGCFWGIEGDAAALRMARRLIGTLAGHSFRLRPERKILYHAAAFLACPTVVTLMEHSAKLLRRSGVPAKLVRPMLAPFVRETAQNFAELGARQALTGPAVRGDWMTVRQHLAALHWASPQVISVYQALVRQMLRIAGRRPPRGLLG
ncbi:MAG TPA: Rossmann-like and DUF2520 domain-containing protein [Terriglobia bacterium]|nr:Rossmann-like and DUF2520 domain-containing protein [Terriglobia bacterium]